jgi:hypothetical protein
MFWWKTKNSEPTQEIDFYAQYRPIEGEKPIKIYYYSQGLVNLKKNFFETKIEFGSLKQAMDTAGEGKENGLFAYVVREERVERYHARPSLVKKYHFVFLSESQTEDDSIMRTLTSAWLKFHSPVDDVVYSFTPQHSFFAIVYDGEDIEKHVGGKVAGGKVLGLTRLYSLLPPGRVFKIDSFTMSEAENYPFVFFVNCDPIEGYLRSHYRVLLGNENDEKMKNVEEEPVYTKRFARKVPSTIAKYFYYEQYSEFYLNTLPKKVRKGAIDYKLPLVPVVTHVPAPLGPRLSDTPRSPPSSRDSSDGSRDSSEPAPYETPTRNDVDTTAPHTSDDTPRSPRWSRDSIESAPYEFAPYRGATHVPLPHGPHDVQRSPHATRVQPNQFASPNFIRPYRDDQSASSSASSISTIPSSPHGNTHRGKELAFTIIANRHRLETIHQMSNDDVLPKALSYLLQTDEVARSEAERSAIELLEKAIKQKGTRVPPPQQKGTRVPSLELKGTYNIPNGYGNPDYEQLRQYILNLIASGDGGATRGGTWVAFSAMLLMTAVSAVLAGSQA